MKEIFKQRRRSYYQQSLKYLRYVFNDHFVLFLLIVLSSLAVQYGQFLQHGRLNALEKAAVILLVSAVSLSVGRLATFVEEADSVFLLAKEEALQKELKSAVWRSLLLPFALSLLFVLLAAPALRFSLGLILAWFVLLVLLKLLLLEAKRRRFVQAAGLNWLELIHYEESRQMRLLKIYALFTTVKGLSNRAKRRKFLDFLLPKRAKSMSAYLYARTFLRMGDYLGLTLRLTLLALLFVAFSQNLLFSFLSVTLFNYLLIFQLFALQQAHAYQPLLKIYPRAGQSPQTALRRLIFNVLAVLVGLESLALLLKETSALLSIFIFAALTLALAYLYCNYRLKLKKSP